MKLTRMRLVGVAAAAVSTIAIAAPVSSASAFAFTPTPLWGTGWGGWPAGAIPFGGAFGGQAAVVIGPTIITTAPSSFINTNNQVSAGGNFSGGQVGLP